MADDPEIFPGIPVEFNFIINDAEQHNSAAFIYA